MIDQDVNARVDAYRGNPQALMQRYQQSQQLIDLLALQKIKSEKEAAARQLQLQMSQHQAASGQAPMTIAQQREQEVMDMTKQELVKERMDTANQQQQQQQDKLKQLMNSGIAAAPGAQTAAAPQAMASGGIVAFGEGGTTGNKKPLDDAARAELEQAEGDRAAMMNTIKKLAAAGYDVATLIPRGVMGAFETGITRPLRALGVPIPYLPESAYGGDRSSMTPMMDKIRRQEASAVPAAPTISTGAQGTEPTPGATTKEVQFQPAPKPPGAPGAPGAPAAPAPAPTPPSYAAPKVELPKQTDFETGIQAAINKDLARDPEAEAKRVQAEAGGIYALPNEMLQQRKDAMAKLQAMDAARFDPEAQRKASLQNFLLGAGGRSNWAGALGAGAASSINYERGQQDLERKMLLERQKMIEDLQGAEHGPKIKAYEAGREAAKGIMGLHEKAITGGATISGQLAAGRSAAHTAEQSRLIHATDAEVKAYLSQLEIASRDRATAATQAGVNETRRLQYFEANNRDEDRYLLGLKTTAQKQITEIEKAAVINPGGKLTPDQVTRITNIQAQLDKDVLETQQKYEGYRKIILGEAVGSAPGWSVKR